MTKHLVEKLNKRLIGKGKPKTYLVFPILETLKSRGYLKESMFIFDMHAEAQEVEIILGSRITLESKNSQNFRELKRKAQRMFMDRIINRSRDLPSFKDRLFKLAKMIVTEYVRKRRWEEPIERDFFF